MNNLSDKKRNKPIGYNEVMIKQLSSKTVYQNKWMTVREDAVEFSEGKTGIYGVVEKPHFALIVPLFKDGFQLVKQYRYPVGETYWEFPQGSYEENPEINPVELAKRELREETGLLAHSMEKIGFLYEAYGFSNQGFHIFLAEDLEQGEVDREISETGMISQQVSFEEFDSLIESGEIKDAPTVAAFGLLRVKKLIPSQN